MDQRELIPEDVEESDRAQTAGILKQTWSSLVHLVVEDTRDGHVLVSQPTVRRRDTDPYGKETFTKHPVHPDVPVNFPGGGGVTLTHPVKRGDEVLVVYTSRPHDSWFQSGGSDNDPVETRMHSMSDGVAVGSVRSKPRKLEQHDNSAAQLRSDDKRHVVQLSPTDGAHVKSVDPSTPPASAGFDPFKQASKFIEHLVHPLKGLLANATDGGDTHSHGVTHGEGAFMRALNGLHSVLAHPKNGASLNAEGLLHSVLAHPQLGAVLSALNGAHTVAASPSGVMLKSSSGIGFDAPSLSFPSGSISSDAVNMSDVAVDLTKVTGADQLKNFANDGAAAAGGVLVGHLYRNGSNLCVRVS